MWESWRIRIRHWWRRLKEDVCSFFSFCVWRDLRFEEIFLPRRKGLAGFICVCMGNNEERKVRQIESMNKWSKMHAKDNWNFQMSTVEKKIVLVTAIILGLVTPKFLT